MTDDNVLPPGLRPDLTPAQIVSGIPILAALLNAFGVYSITQAQTDSLQNAALWAIALVGADAVVRTGRNVHLAAHAKANPQAPVPPVE